MVVAWIHWGPMHPSGCHRSWLIGLDSAVGHATLITAPDGCSCSLINLLLILFPKVRIISHHISTKNLFEKNWRNVICVIDLSDGFDWMGNLSVHNRTGISRTDQWRASVTFSVTMLACHLVQHWGEKKLVKQRRGKRVRYKLVYSCCWLGIGPPWYSWRIPKHMGSNPGYGSRDDWASTGDNGS